MNSLSKKLGRVVLRNKILLKGEKAVKNRVNLDYWAKKDNVGDLLGPAIFDWMKKQKGIPEDAPAKKTGVLLTVGSIIGMNHYDAVIWGSGVHTIASALRLFRWRRIVHYDVRALRGPISKHAMEFAGYDVSKAVYGDPAVLMPLIYKPEISEKKYKVSIINHWYYDSPDDNGLLDGANTIYVNTKDYRKFIDEIASSELVISSSLHGIILAEAYGVPAVFYNHDNCMIEELMKYYDWYYSTGRYSVKMALTLEDALNMTPMPLPDLETMRADLRASFPYDLWK